MKYILALFFLWLCNLSTVAQFIVTNDGFVDSLNTSRNYVIIDTNSETKEDAIKRIATALSTKFCGIDDNLSVDGDVIILDGKRHNAIDDSGLGLTIKGFYHIVYRVVIMAKDGRVRMEIPQCQLAASQVFKGEKDIEAELSRKKDLTEYELYNSKGKPKKKVTIKSLQDFANNIYSIISNPAVEDDW